MVSLEEMKIMDLHSTKKLAVIVKAKVIGVKQTQGPTVFFLRDETGSLKVAAFAGKGKRAYPDIQEGDFVKAHVLVQPNRNGGRNFIINSMEKLGSKESEDLEKAIESSKMERLITEVREFSVDSRLYEKMRDRFKRASLIILEALEEGRGIYLRHHNDIDGYISAMLLEKAILSACEKLGNNTSAISRINLKTPFYSYSDLLKDLSLMERDRKKPLLIILDCGSSGDDMLSLEKAIKLGIQLIVIDHHPVHPGITNIGMKNKAVVINPYLKGGDKNVCTAMLSFELARIMAGSEKIDEVTHWAAIAALSDKCKGREALKYINAAFRKHGKDLVEKARWCVDFTIYSMKNTNSTEIIKNILKLDGEGKELIDIIYPYVEESIKKQLEIMKRYSRKIEKTNCSIYVVDMEDTSTREYPPAGRATGLFFDEVQSKKRGVIVLGIINSGVVVRVDEKLKDTYGKERMKHEIRKRVGDFVELGGHDVAYTIKAPSCSVSEILKIFEGAGE